MPNIFSDKITFIYPSLELGGQQTQILNLAKEFVKRGYRVNWIFENHGPINDENVKFCKLKVLKIQNNFLRNLKISRYLILLINSLLRYLYFRNHLKDVGLVIVSDTYSSIIVGRCCNRRTKIYRMIGQDVKKLEKPWFNYYQVLNVDNYIDAYFGWPKVYEDLRKIGIKNYKLKAFPAHAVNTKHFTKSNQVDVLAMKKKLGIDLSEVVIGWVGRIEERMQAKYTLELAIELNKQKHIKFKFLFVGGGKKNNIGIEDRHHLEELRKKAENTGISDQVIFTGWVDYTNIPSYYSVMDFVPLLEEDPQGGSLLREAMSTECIPVSVDGISKSQSVFLHPQHSILISPKSFIQQASNEVLRLSQDPEKFQSMKREARKYALTKLSFEHQASCILDSYIKQRPHNSV